MELVHAGQDQDLQGWRGRSPGLRGDKETIARPKECTSPTSRNAQFLVSSIAAHSYPNAGDRALPASSACRRAGRLDSRPAKGCGYIGSAHGERDWTYGCIAVTDEEIEEIWKLMDKGTPIEIRP